MPSFEIQSDIVTTLEIFDEPVGESNAKRRVERSVSISMDYLRMNEKQYASKVRNKALEDFDWLSQWLE